MFQASPCVALLLLSRCLKVSLIGHKLVIGNSCSLASNWERQPAEKEDLYCQCNDYAVWLVTCSSRSRK